MSAASSISEHYRAEFARQAANLPSAANDELGARRRASLDVFARQGFPTRKQEDWKYTALKPLLKNGFSMPQQPGHITSQQLQAYLPAALDGPRLVFVDGYFNAALSQLGDPSAGITLSHLAASSDWHAGWIDRQNDGATNTLLHMNTAFMRDGLLLELADNAQLNAPLHLLVISSGQQERAMSQLRHVIRLGTNSHAHIIEHHVGLGSAPYFCNTVMQLDVGPGASLDRVRLQQESAHGIHIASLYARLDRDSSFNNHGVDLGGQLVRADTNVRLDAAGAQTALHGVYLPGEGQHIDNHTRVDHAQPNGRSREAYRGIIDGNGRGVFNGKVVVHKHAQKTDSNQSTDALLLSKRAEIDAKPELEIYADDVKCNHGSTVGQLDEDAIFYLRSRGVEHKDARAILTYSFADALIQHIQPESLREAIESALRAKLSGSTPASAPE